MSSRREEQLEKGKRGASGRKKGEHNHSMGCDRVGMTKTWAIGVAHEVRELR